MYAIVVGLVSEFSVRLYKMQLNYILKWHFFDILFNVDLIIEYMTHLTEKLIEKKTKSKHFPSFKFSIPKLKPLQPALPLFACTRLGCRPLG